MKPGKRGKSRPGKRKDVASDDDDLGDVVDPGDRSFIYDEVDEHAAYRTRMVDDEEDDRMEADNVVGFKDLGVDESGDSEDEFYEEQMARIKKQLRKEELASDLEDEDEEDAEGRDISDAWGKRMSHFRGADVVDPKDEERARMEEEEAATLRARIAKDFDEADFDITQFLPESAEPAAAKKAGEKQKKKKSKANVIDANAPFVPVVERNLAKLPKAQKLDLVRQESPELLPLLPEFKEKLEELEKTLRPAMERIKVVGVPDVLEDYVRLNFDIVANYCVNLSFYLALKSRRTPVANHPIIKRLLGFRKLLKELEPAREKLHPLVEKLVLGENVPPISVSEGREMSSLVSVSKKASREVNDSGSDDGEEDVEDADGGDEDGQMGDPWVVEEGGKRAISYKIAKNKGLVARKKKELRNPRVKHKLKYRKAKIRRKGQVREVRKEIKRYEGEISGIRAGVVKSVKFK